MTRQMFIEKTLRQVYGQQPTDDSNITNNLVNTWLNEAIGLAVKANYKDNLQVAGMGYINNSFYYTFSGLTITRDPNDNFLYSITLPQLPFSVGRNEGVATLQFVDAKGFVSYNAIPLAMNEQGLAGNMRKIPNALTYYPQGTFLKVNAVIPLYSYTAVVKMVSGGDATDLTSILNVPDDYLPVITNYIREQLMAERAAPQDLANDGEDN